MKGLLAKMWENASSSYWLVPGGIAIGAFFLAIGIAQLDAAIEHPPEQTFGWFYGGEPASARALLSAITTAMMTVISLTFSVTVVALTLAAGQFGSRLLYSFMRDRANQTVLGTFLGTFVYALLTLRMIKGEDGEAWMPHIGVTVSVILVLISVGMLIYFIHHVVEEIQVNNVIAAVAKELNDTIVRSLPARSREPEPPGQAAVYEQVLHLLERPAKPVPAQREGVLQLVEVGTLVAWAQRHDLMLRLRYQPGDFITGGSPAFDVYPADRVPDHAANACSQALLVGARRSMVQDIEFGFDQLVEIAVRALSPGINDPYSAIACLDRLGASMLRVMAREPLPAVHFDGDGEPRVVLKTTDFESLLRRSFMPIRRHGAGDINVLAHLLIVHGRLLEGVTDEEQHRAIWQQTTLTYETALGSAHNANEQAFVHQRYRALLQPRNGD